MKIFKLPLAGLLFCTAPLLAGCGTSDKPEAPVSLTWEMGTGNAEPGYYENSFVLKNISGAPLPRKLDNLLFATSPQCEAGRESCR